MTTAADYSWARPSIDALKAAGVAEVGRYVGPPAWGKTITQPEFDALAAAGIGVFLVFEAGADDWQGGENAGVVNAHLALQYVPTGYTGPLYVAVDTAVNPPDALSYVRGFAGGRPPEDTGVYGEGGLIVLAHDAGVATAPGWQSASTSFPGNATTTPDTGIQQGLGGPLPGTDADTILRPLIPTPVAPAPPAPAPTPPPVKEATMAVTSTYSYRSGQRDIFQVILGGLEHYWQNVGPPGHETIAGPVAGAGKTPVVTTFPDQVPQVDIAGGVVRVTVEDATGHPYTFSQGQFDPANPSESNGWTVTSWLG